MRRITLQKNTVLPVAEMSRQPLADGVRGPLPRLRDVHLVRAEDEPGALEYVLLRDVDPVDGVGPLRRALDVKPDHSVALVRNQDQGAVGGLDDSLLAYVGEGGAWEKVGYTLEGVGRVA